MSDEDNKHGDTNVPLSAQIRTSLWTRISKYLEALFGTAEVFNMHAIFAESETALLAKYHDICKDITNFNHLPTGEEAAQYARGKQPDVDDQEVGDKDRDKASEDHKLFVAQMWDFWANHKHFLTKSVPFLKQMLQAFETQYSWSEGCLPHQEWYEGSECEDQDIAGVCALIDLAHGDILKRRDAKEKTLEKARKRRRLLNEK